MKNMRILIVNSLYPPNVIGGAEISTQKLAEELAKRGEEVFVLTTGDKDDVSEQKGVTIYRRRFCNIMSFWEFKHSTFGKRLVWKFIDYLNPCNAKAISEILKMVRPDVVHTNTIYGIAPYIWKCAEKQNIPIVQTLRDYNLMCPKSNMMKRGAHSCKKTRVACRIFRAGYRSLSKTVDAVTAPSEYTLSLFTNDGYFPKARKIVVYNAIDFDEQSFRRIAVQKVSGHK